MACRCCPVRRIVLRGEGRRGNRRAVFCGEFMTKSKSALIAGFTYAEREYIRRELDQFFSTLPTVAEGF